LDLDLRERGAHTMGLHEELGLEVAPAMVYDLRLRRWRIDVDEEEDATEGLWHIPPLQHKGDRFFTNCRVVVVPTNLGSCAILCLSSAAWWGPLHFLGDTPDQGEREMDLVLMTRSRSNTPTPIFSRNH
jgi:hypothetical protein